jgi:deazaflavin-dependent oxidoreductase (nitroreductase family)
MHLPFFLVRPPKGFGVITTTGRRTGKARRRCIRVVRAGDTAYAVAIKGAGTGWFKNARANPQVRLRIGGGTFDATAREVHDPAELERARRAYCDAVNWFDYLECAMHRSGRPTREKIRDLHRTWMERGAPIAFELRR